MYYTMMKQAFLTGLLLSALSAQASDYTTLVFQTSSGGATAVSLSSLVLTVSGGKLTATNSSGTQTFTLSDLSKMYFSTDASTAISGVASATDGEAVSVTSLQGLNMGSYTTLEAARKALRPGVYVVKQQEKTFKLVVK